MSSCAKNLPFHSKPPPPAPGLVAIKKGASLIAQEGRALSGRLIDFLPPEVNPKILAYRDALHPVILVVNSLTKTEEDAMVDLVGAMTDNVGIPR